MTANPKLFFDEMRGLTGEVLPHYKPFVDWVEKLPAEYLVQKRQEADVLFQRVGITFAVYGEEAGTERLIPFDIVPRIIPAADWQRARARARAARARAQPVPARHLQRAGDPQGRDHPRPQGPRERAVPLGDAGHARPGRHLRAHRRRRRRARGRRRVLRPRGQPARAVGRVVHAREPQDDDAALPRGVRAERGGADRPLPRPPARHAAAGGAERGERPDGGAPHARVVQLGLLRAHLPRAADGDRAGRGPGPDRARRDGLHAHDARTEASRRDLPARRRRLPRPAGVPAGLAARRARVSSRRTRPAG